MHRRAFAAIEHPKLNARGIDCLAHRAAERIDLANDLPLADAADRRIAAHLADRVAIRGEQGRFGSQSGSRQRGFGASMAGANNDHIVLIFACGHALSITSERSAGTLSYQAYACLN